MKQKVLIGIVVILLFLPLLNLLQPGLPQTHDGQDHVARIANFYQNLLEGNIIPRWAANLNWGYGHPVLMFLYPLPSYLASLFHFLGFSFVDSTKLVFASAFILSMVTMYLWLRAFLSEKAAIIGSLLYGYAPYHFVDLYVRGAIGELMAFVFPPLVLYFIFKLSQKNSYGYILGGSLALAGFILAHNAVSLMFLPVLFLYVIYLVLRSKHKKIFLTNTVLIVLFGFVLSAFFWFPAFMEGKYTLRDIVTEKVYQDRFVSLTQLLHGDWNYGQTGEFTVQVGLVHWLLVLSGIPWLIYLYKKKNKQWWFLAGLLFVFSASLFLMTPYAGHLWDKVTLLQKFQFPWRFLFLTMFTAAVVGAFVFSLIPKKFQNTVFFILIALLLLTTKDMWYAKGYFQKPETFYTSVYKGTTDTGESAPIWSVRFMEETPKAPLEIISGVGKIQEGERTTTKHQYIITADQKIQLRENTLYFPGWKILVDDKQTAIEFQDAHNRGVMTFWVEKGTHTVSVNFQETKVRFFANLVSLTGLCVLLLLSILKKRLWQN
jgi:uncharacterized membrane protein